MLPKDDRHGGALRKIACVRSIQVWMTLGMLSCAPAWGMDRITTVVPLDFPSTVDESTGDALPFATAPGGGMAVSEAMAAQSVLVDALDREGGWSRYLAIWQRLAEKPDDPIARRFLSLPLSPKKIRLSRGRKPPVGVPWRSGQFHRLATPLLLMDSSADENDTREVARDLQRCYWLWTQVFFPLWKSAAAVTRHTEPQSDLASAHRVPSPGTMRVVLFRDRDEYLRVLSPQVPGIASSTGYYDDTRRTSYFYVGSDPDTAASRRHEWTHQLFREATTSKLGAISPGKERDFWLVEGIAGYMESIHFAGSVATVGGWDSPRLQYARYRVLVGGDSVPIEELRDEGQSEVQARDDLARWYSHSIAWTHGLMDGFEKRHRESLIKMLADLYRIDLPETDSIHGWKDLSLERFLRVDDSHLLEHPVKRSLTDLCLADCQISPSTIETIPASPHLNWIDLTGIAVDASAVGRLVMNPASLERLSLERTNVASSIASLVAKCSTLTDFDVTSTRVDNDVVKRLPDTIESLYLTNTSISDEMIDRLIAMPRLAVVDVQLSRVSPSGIQRLKSARPELTVNPLAIRRPE